MSVERANAGNGIVVDKLETLSPWQGHHGFHIRPRGPAEIGQRLHDVEHIIQSGKSPRIHAQREARGPMP